MGAGGRKSGEVQEPDFGFRPDEEDVSVSRHVINWYPGHIAKAERELQDFLKLVDVVVEARDARIPTATTHPLVRQWVGRRPLIVAMTRKDMAPSAAIKEWSDFYVQSARAAHRIGQPRVPVVFVDSRQGTDIHRLKMIALKAGAAVNERRARLGLLPRSIRVAVIGYPNVGKSAIINKLIGRRLAKSKNMPGVTKRISWVRLGAAAMGSSRKEEELELLDSPGIIPAKQVDQATAFKLAVCNDIGQASYDVQVVAGELINMLRRVHARRPGYVDLSRLEQRYQLDPCTLSGEEYLHALAAKLYRGNLYSAADRLMSDFRKGHFGPVTLEIPPEMVDLEEKKWAMAGEETREEKRREKERRRELMERMDRKEILPIEVAPRERDMESNVEEKQGSERESRQQRPGEGESPKVGVGQFEGW
jgi:ribosome biogenesis GTPase A